MFSQEPESTIKTKLPSVPEISSDCPAEYSTRKKNIAEKSSGPGLSDGSLKLPARPEAEIENNFPTVSKTQALIELVKMAWHSDPKLCSLQILKSVADSTLTIASAWVWSKWINAMVESYAAGALSTDLKLYFTLSTACILLHTEDGDGIINRICDYFATKFSNKYAVAVDAKINEGISSLPIEVAENSKVQQRIVRVDENPVADDIVVKNVLRWPEFCISLGIAGSTIFLYDWKMGLCLTMATLPSIWLERKYVSKHFEMEGENSSAKQKRSWVDWCLRRQPAQREILALDKGSLFARLSKAYHKEAAEREVALEKKFLAPRIACSSIFYAAQAVVFYNIMKSAVSGSIQIDTVLFTIGMLSTYSSAFHNACVQLIELFGSLIYAQDSVGLMLQKKSSHKKEKSNLPNLYGKIKVKFRNVGFEYPSEEINTENINYAVKLKDLNFSFESGQISVIVGPSGSGKSTILRLLKGIRRATEGQILFTDAENNQHLEQEGGFDQVALTFSETSRFGALTIKDAIHLGRGKETNRSYSDVLDLAGVDFLHQFTELDNTIIASDIGGVDLSSGQQARVNFARAIMTGKPIWALDEPFSHLDWRSCEKIIDSLQQLARDGAAIIFVTHDLKLIDYAQQVIVLNSSGEVEFIGSPGEAKAKSNFVSASFKLEL